MLAADLLSRTLFISLISFVFIHHFLHTLNLNALFILSFLHELHLDIPTSLEQQKQSDKRHDNRPEAQIEERPLDTDEEESDCHQEDEYHAAQPYRLHLGKAHVRGVRRQPFSIVSLLDLQPAPKHLVNATSFLLLDLQLFLPVVLLFHISGEEIIIIKI